MKKVAPHIDFADSSFKSCETFIDSSYKTPLIVYLTSWEEKEIKITFRDMLQFIYRGGSIIAGLYEITEETAMLKESISLKYEIVPKDHPFKTFVIVDIEDFYVLEVVAEDVTVTKQ